ncbi:MAG: type II toxin-antitoxin system death-on-curing family toxin [Aggregatilineales bacterium]
MTSNNDNPDTDEIIYLTMNDFYNINAEVTEMQPFVRDQRLLRSAAARPMLVVFGEEQFPTRIDKAAAMLHSLAYHHLFTDGNKRTAARAVELFLQHNGLALTWDDDFAKQFILEVAQGKHEPEDIAEVLQEYTQPL